MGTSAPVLRPAPCPPFRGDGAGGVAAAAAAAAAAATAAAAAAAAAIDAAADTAEANASRRRVAADFGLGRIGIVPVPVMVEPLLFQLRPLLVLLLQTQLRKLSREGGSQQALAEEQELQASQRDPLLARLLAMPVGILPILVVVVVVVVVVLRLLLLQVQIPLRKMSQEGGLQQLLGVDAGGVRGAGGNGGVSASPDAPEAAVPGRRTTADLGRGTTGTAEPMHLAPCSFVGSAGAGGVSGADVGVGAAAVTAAAAPGTSVMAAAGRRTLTGGLVRGLADAGEALRLSVSCPVVRRAGSCDAGAGGGDGCGAAAPGAAVPDSLEAASAGRTVAVGLG
eukprot:g2206.t1